MSIGYSNFQFFIEFYLEDNFLNYVVTGQVYNDAWLAYCAGGEL